MVRTASLIHRNRLRRLCLCGLLVCLLFYLVIDRYSDSQEYRLAQIPNGYFVDHGGCAIPAMDIFNMEIVKFMEPVTPPKCKWSAFVCPIYDQDGNAFFVLCIDDEILLRDYAESDIAEIHCTYHSVKRVDDTRNELLNLIEKFRLLKGLRLKIKPGIENVRIECFNARNISLLKDVHYILPKPIRQQEKPSPSRPTPTPLSVMILGIDSLSHLNFHRQMPRTAAFIRTQLPHIEFWGYNKVGSNTFPNLMPLLSGLSDLEVIAQYTRNGQTFDDCNFIWKPFKNAGYRTAFGEDSSLLSLFNYQRSGFAAQPTDYYLHTSLNEIEKFSKYSSNTPDVYCSGELSFPARLLLFLEQLRPHMRQNPFFSFFWWVQGVHTNLNHANLLDKSFDSTLNKLRHDGTLNHTLVLLMSDHGQRWGPFRETFQGMLEDSQPLLIAIYPHWLQSQYPQAINTLKENGHSLVTSYDLYPTLLDLLDLRQLKAKRLRERTLQLQAIVNKNVSKMPRGISLFLPVPDQRNCRYAHIPIHFCLCQNLVEINAQQPTVQRAGRFVVLKINEQLKQHPQCRLLQLHKIQKSYLSVHGAMVTQKESPYTEIRLRLITMPGSGKFEATVRIYNRTIGLVGAVTRINAYGHHSRCVHNYNIERYCYCNNQTEVHT